MQHNDRFTQDTSHREQKIASVLASHRLRQRPLVHAVPVLTFLHDSAQLAQLGADGVHALCLLYAPVAHAPDCCGALHSTRRVDNEAVVLYQGPAWPVHSKPVVAGTEIA